MNNIAIVVIAYNRVNSLARLLNSLKNATYNEKEVCLIISIDNSGINDVYDYATSFEWPYGDKKVILNSKRLGLHKHVLQCGNLTDIYNSIIVLEDDVYVSRHFFDYAVQTIKKYESNDHIAGISLYSHQWNVGVNRPFTPLDNGYDVYFMQYAQSWGQIWTKRMWKHFYEWYVANKENLNEINGVPSYVLNWSMSSWLKYYISYIVDTGRYFVYPYVSLTTNFTDIGSHNKIPTTSYQVPLITCIKGNYELPDFDKNIHSYDVYFEIEGLERNLEISQKNICIDFYGKKKNYDKRRYWLSTLPAPYKVIRSFSMELRPQELNVINNLKGKEIFLYDTHVMDNQFTKKRIRELEIAKIRYDIKATSNKKLLKLLMFEMLIYIKKRIA